MYPWTWYYRPLRISTTTNVLSTHWFELVALEEPKGFNKISYLSWCLWYVLGNDLVAWKLDFVYLFFSESLLNNSHWIASNQRTVLLFYVWQRLTSCSRSTHFQAGLAYLYPLELNWPHALLYLIRNPLVSLETGHSIEVTSCRYQPCHKKLE